MTTAALEPILTRLLAQVVPSPAPGNGTAVGGDAGIGSLEAWASVAGVLAGALLVAWAFDRFAMALLRAFATRTSTTKDDAVLEALHRPLLFLVATALAAGSFRAFPARFPAIAVQAADVLEVPALVLAAAYGGTRLLRALYTQRGVARGNKAIVQLASRLTAIVVYVVAFLIIIDHFGLTITPLLTSLGIAGLAVALALQDTLSNFFAGMWIQTGRAMQPGHYIKVEGKNVEGFVERVGWRATYLRTLPNNLVVIPNAELAKAVVVDHHLPTAQMGTNIEFTVERGSDVEAVERMALEEAMEAARTVPGMLVDPPPAVRFNPGIVDFGYRFWVGFRVASHLDQYLAQHEVRKRILSRLLREGVGIPDIRERKAFETGHGPEGRPDVPRAPPAAAPAAGTASGPRPAGTGQPGGGEG